jgi:hypothetical protein
MVANTGEGQYGADLRHYRVRWLRDNGDGTFSQSEPGQPAAFQPSGAGLAVRVSRPEPPGAGETHWTIEQSANGRDWNRRGGDGQPIGREWLDDAWAVSAYPSERTRAALLGRLSDWHPVSVRLSLWTSALIQLSSGARPLLIGGGMGESQVVSLREDPRYDSVHNAFLQVALDFGLIGLALVAVFHWHVLCALHAQSGWRSTLCLAGVVFWLGVGLTATVTDTHPYWLFLGVAAAQAAGARGAADPHIR